MDLPPALTLEQLRTAVQADRLDTVLLALTDMQGRLQGKRLTARHFLDTSAGWRPSRAPRLEPAQDGNAYVAGKPRVPSTLGEARALFAASEAARAAFGEEVVEHYLNAARVELVAFESFVTDWERVRGFERL